MRGKSKSIKYSGTVREILGTCTSVGCSVKYEMKYIVLKILLKWLEKVKSIVENMKLQLNNLNNEWD